MVLRESKIRECKISNILSRSVNYGTVEKNDAFPMEGDAELIVTAYNINYSE